MIDQEIRDALKADPSPEFLARVRTRIASEPAPSAWRWSWTVAAASARAAAVAIAVMVSRPEPPLAPTSDVAQAAPRPDANASSSVAQALRPAIAGLKPHATTAEPRATAAEPRGTGTPAVSGFSQTVAADPDILIDPREQRALRQLIAGVSEGRVDLSAAQNSTPPASAALEPVTDIVIAPINIDPLAPLAGAEGVRP